MVERRERGRGTGIFLVMQRRVVPRVFVVTPEEFVDCKEVSAVSRLDIRRALSIGDHRRYNGKAFGNAVVDECMFEKNVICRCVLLR